MTQIVDAYNQPIKTTKPPVRSLATVQVRDKWGLYPANGLTPQRLAHILREADQGDMLQQAELFSQLEERDGHLASIFQTRKLAISGLEWKFAPFSDDAKDKQIAEDFAAVWEELDTDELLLDMMDAVSKGVSFTALNWTAQDGGVLSKAAPGKGPVRFAVNGSEWIDQKHWRYDLDDKRFRLMTDEQPLGMLPQFGQVIEHRYKARSGSPTRAGVMRTCVWGKKLVRPLLVFFTRRLTAMFGRRRANVRREPEPEIAGEVGYFKLTDWWLGSLSLGERKLITDKRGDVTTGKITSTTQTAAWFLLEIVSHLKGSEENRLLARKLLNKAESLATKIKDKHFVLGETAEVFYRDRDTDPNALDRCIKACHEQIALAPEAAKAFGRERYSMKHEGFERLRIIYKKQKRAEEGVRLCEQMVESGWYKKRDVEDWKEAFEKQLAKPTA